MHIWGTAMMTFLWRAPPSLHWISTKGPIGFAVSPMLRLPTFMLMIKLILCRVLPGCWVWQRLQVCWAGAMQSWTANCVRCHWGTSPTLPPLTLEMSQCMVHLLGPPVGGFHIVGQRLLWGPGLSLAPLLGGEGDNPLQSLKPKKVPSTVHGTSWRQVLVTIVPSSVMGPTPDVLCQVKDKLALHHSLLEAQAASEAYGGFSISTDRAATEAELSFVREAARATFPDSTRAEVVLPSSMLYLKLVDIPYYFNDKVITPEVVLSHLNGSGLADLLVLSTPPWVVHDSCMSDTTMVYLNIADSVSGSRAKALLSQVVQIGQFVCPFRAAWANPRSALCQRCWRWGHPTSTCHAPQGRCPICSGPHRKKHHRMFVGCCKGSPKAIPPVLPMAFGMLCLHPPRCINCCKGHTADSRQCNFWCHQFDSSWIKAHYEEVCEAAHSWLPHAYPPHHRRRPNINEGLTSVIL